MHVVNKILGLANMKLSRTIKIPREFKQNYNYGLRECEKNDKGFKVLKELRYESGDHPYTYRDFECAFTANHLHDKKPSTVLDVGSHRHFILGLLSHFRVTTVDVRERPPVSDNETIVTCDARDLNLPDNSFDAVVSLCSLEHFGLGRYGDEFDLDADKKAFNEMVRVLKVGGLLVFTTEITRAQPSIVYNSHRIYSYEMIRSFCDGLDLEEEKFFSLRIGSLCSFDQITTNQHKTSLPEWDVYLGCWVKK